MKLLQELINQTSSDKASVRLTDTQKSVLLGIYVAPTQETAYDVTTGSENVHNAKIQLRKLELITVDDASTRAAVTDDGQVALSNNNLIDDMGEVTEVGNEVLARIDDIKAEFNYATESYITLKALI